MATEQEQIEKAALEYANQIVLEAQDSPEYFAFINGVEWQKEQSANDAIEMLQWLVEQDNAVLLYEGLLQHKASAKDLSKQLYELWQKTK